MENKTGKYLKYAVGEIILVVIGILIALQINNWNETNKAKVNERELLTYVLENIKTDSISIDSIISRSDRVLMVQQNLIKLSNGELRSHEVGNLDLLRSSEPNQTVTKKNNPNLANEVRSQDLKKIILNYFLALDWLEFTIETNNEIIETKIRPFLGEKKLLNYGNQLETNLNRLNLINSEMFYEEFQKEELRQLLFESGIKLRIMKLNAQRTMLKNIELKNDINNYLKT
ncbi:DUF6090 family protein [Sediminicola sp. YIK13]|uniref:DUF6090 family protein n=1 Tax=Sediminicola sp. YIK13 TaxID=1453352 RepID=UPI000784714E|nr:DUF6090 family protein [Sediminicola sp. YIK13]